MSAQLKAQAAKVKACCDGSTQFDLPTFLQELAALWQLIQSLLHPAPANDPVAVKAALKKAGCDDPTCDCCCAFMSIAQTSMCAAGQALSACANCCCNKP